MIAKGDPSNTVYIGRTWGTRGIRGRIRQFNRSALTGQKGHAGGVTFHGLFDGDTTGLFVSVHLPNGIDFKPEILHPYIGAAFFACWMIGLPSLLRKNYAHFDMGVYAEVVAGGTIKLGDEVTLQ